MSTPKKDKQPLERIPEHVAVIMDGNGRWARQRGWPRVRGHQEGAESVRAVVKACKNLGIRYLTLYAFSMENWVRPSDEVQGLMELLREFLAKQEEELHENEIRLRIIGRRCDLPEDIRNDLKRVENATSEYGAGTLVLALSYGGRAEIVDAVRRLAEDVRDGSVSPDEIDEEAIRSRLYAPDIPDPDLLIRTSGEMRLSNFLLWQVSYSELYVTPVLWPDFREEEFMQALHSYAQRHRRFGDIE